MLQENANEQQKEIALDVRDALMGKTRAQINKRKTDIKKAELTEKLINDIICDIEKNIDKCIEKGLYAYITDKEYLYIEHNDINSMNFDMALKYSSEFFLSYKDVVKIGDYFLKHGYNSRLVPRFENCGGYNSIEYVKFCVSWFHV